MNISDILQAFFLGLGVVVLIVAGVIGIVFGIIKLADRTWGLILIYILIISALSFSVGWTILHPVHQ